jgi:hypothetical protein
VKTTEARNRLDILVECGAVEQVTGGGKGVRYTYKLLHSTAHTKLPTLDGLISPEELRKQLKKEAKKKNKKEAKKKKKAKTKVTSTAGEVDYDEWEPDPDLPSDPDISDDWEPDPDLPSDSDDLGLDSWEPDFGSCDDPDDGSDDD